MSGCVEVGIQTPWATDGPFIEDLAARGHHGWVAYGTPRTPAASLAAGRPYGLMHRTAPGRAPHVHATLLSEATAWEGTGKRVEEEVHRTCADLRMMKPPPFPP